MRCRAGWNREKYVFAKLTRKEDIIIDAGANYGLYTRFFSMWVGKHGHVHGFEPVSPTFDSLQRTCREEGCLPNVTLNPKALGEKEQEVSIYVPGNAFGKASFHEHVSEEWRTKGKGIREYKVIVTTLDQYVRVNEISRIDFIKIDIEGAELLALKGGLHTLQRMQPIVHIEFYGEWFKAFNYEARDIINLMKSIGYDLVILYDENLLAITDEQHILEYCYQKPINVVFAIRDKHKRRLKSLSWDTL